MATLITTQRNVAVSHNTQRAITRVMMGIEATFMVMIGILTTFGIGSSAFLSQGAPAEITAFSGLLFIITGIALLVGAVANFVPTPWVLLLLFAPELIYLYYAAPAIIRLQPPNYFALAIYVKAFAYPAIITVFAKHD